MSARPRPGATPTGIVHGPDRFTVVAFHAHPDDEALLSGGTLAKAAAGGHRVVLVTATRGELGLAGAEDGFGDDLGQVRMAELLASADILGCARVVWLGYLDSGLTAHSENVAAFANANVDAAAHRLAEVLREEQADVLTIYDRNGGYGHPDHVQVHRVGTLAAQVAGTRVVLEATVSAGLFRGLLLLLRTLGHALGTSAPLGTHNVFSGRKQITHRINVNGFLQEKRAAMSAHGSQRRAEGQVRVMDILVRLPPRLFGLAFGHEWFIEHDRTPARKEADVFASLRRT